MRTICAAFLVMLLMLTPLLVTDAGAMELGDVDVVWAGWEQDTGPPVVVVDNAQLFTIYQSDALGKTSQPAAVRSDNLGSPTLEANDANTGTHKLTASLGDGTSNRRMVTAWRAGEARAGQNPMKSG